MKDKIDIISDIPFYDYAIKRFINENGEIHICDWTKKSSKCISFSDLIEFIDERILSEYVEPFEAGAIYDKEETFYEDRFPGLMIQNSIEVVTDWFVETPYEILDEIADRLTHEYWTRKDMYIPSHGEYLAKGWEEFTQIIKHKVRYMFFSDKLKRRTPSYEDYSDPYTILEEIKKGIIQHKLITEFKENELNVFRARQHDCDIELKTADELGSPPERIAQANRLSPAGISMFYGAFEKDTAVIEIVDISKTKDSITIGKFINIKRLRLIDFSKLQWISLFDTEKEELRESYVLLGRYRDDLNLPISNDGSQHIDYIPTQIVTEYLKNSFVTDDGKEIHGIVYPSAKRKNYNNVVLFFDNNLISENKTDKSKYLVLDKKRIKKYLIKDINFSINLGK